MKTIIGHEESGNWMFFGRSAKLVSEICGLSLYNGNGHVVALFKADDEYKYTGRIVKEGYKICIN